jgi:hypothetical protein
LFAIRVNEAVPLPPPYAARVVRMILIVESRDASQKLPPTGMQIVKAHTTVGDAATFGMA